MPSTRVPVRCSDRDGCGWSGVRGEETATLLKCPHCRLYSVVMVPRTPDPTVELFALAAARVRARALALADGAEPDRAAELERTRREELAR